MTRTFSPRAPRRLSIAKQEDVRNDALSSSEGGIGVCLAIPGCVIEVVDHETRLAKVDVAGVRRNVNVGLLDDGVSPGDWVLIHVGFALSKVDEGEARATLGLLQKMGDAYEQELEDLKASVIE
jgi:hydrogenase expression/formation protein HypC